MAAKNLRKKKHSNYGLSFTGVIKTKIH